MTVLDDSMKYIYIKKIFFADYPRRLHFQNKKLSGIHNENPYSYSLRGNWSFLVYFQWENLKSVTGVTVFTKYMWDGTLLMIHITRIWNK